MRKGDVIRVASDHPSFKWGDGLFVITKVHKYLIEAYKINSDYTLQSTLTGIGKGFQTIHKTKLRYKL